MINRCQKLCLMGSPFLLLFFLLSFPVNAEFIANGLTSLKESPHYQANTVLTLNKGERVAVLKEEGFWKQVRVRGVSGWVTRLSVVDSPPLSKLSGLELKKKKQPAGRVIRTRVATAAVGVKGLRASQVEKIEESYNTEALKKMESFVVAEQKAIEFVMDHQESD